MLAAIRIRARLYADVSPVRPAVAARGHRADSEIYHARRQDILPVLPLVQRDAFEHSPSGIAYGYLHRRRVIIVERRECLIEADGETAHHDRLALG